MSKNISNLNDKNMENKPQKSQISSSKKLENRLFSIVTGMVLFVMTMLGTNLYFQYSNYTKGIKLVERDGSSKPEDHAIILTYSRAWDFAVIKTSTLFLAFMLIFLGTLYLLRVAETSYSLSVASPGNEKLSFSTASPGLVLVTLGTIIVIVLLFSKSSINYEAQAPNQPEDYTDSGVGIPFLDEESVTQPND